MDTDIVRFMIVDDHHIVREGMASLLSAFPDLVFVGEGSNGKNVVQLYEETQPDVVLMDLVMPEVDGIEAIKQLNDAYPDSKIIALSSYADDELVTAVLEAGVLGYLLKNVSAFELAQAIRMAKRGISLFAPEIRNTLGRQNAGVHKKNYDITDREYDVLQLVVRGLSNDQIANELHISKFTVKNHVSSLLAKLNVSSRSAAIHLALCEELVPLD